MKNTNTRWCANVLKFESREHLIPFYSDIDPCDVVLQSENETFFGFSNRAAVQSASASLMLSTWIMSSFFHRVEKPRYGTSKHYA